MLQILTIAAVVISTAGIVLLVLLLRRSGGGAPLERALREELRLGREEAANEARRLREELAAGQGSAMETLARVVGELGKSQAERLDGVSRGIRELTESNETRIERLRGTVEERLGSLQESNERKLDQMRETVDEKLQSTLERRLGESFKLVSDRLEAVQRGLGEMQGLASDVGNLQKVLTKVKTRGIFGEVQLGAILEQILTPEQYGTDVVVKEGSRERVEFAVRLPGREDDPSSCVWLPIDSKFPQEDYQRLIEASERGDADVVQRASADIERTAVKSAKAIEEKYVYPPSTTDFAIMFLPTEGLYAELLRRPGLLQRIQRDHRVIISGPTTLSALLSSLRMGFRTLAIEKRSSEVWEILRAVKTEFGKFGGILDKVKRQLRAASNTIEETGARTRRIESRLSDVECLPGERAGELLGLPEGSPPPQEDEAAGAAEDS